MNRDTIGNLEKVAEPVADRLVWTGKFDLNTLRVDVNIFQSGKKKLRIQKYPDTCGRYS